MKEGKSPRKPLIFYYLIVMVVMTLLNAFVFPAMMNMSVTEVGYDSFRKLVDEDKVRTVEIGDNYVAFIAEVETVDGGTREAVFKTGLMDDPGLNDRLYEAGVTYGKVIPTESSPIISFITTWVFPLIFFIAIGSFLMKMMQKKGGGPGAMQFGKSNAKVYVEAQTGKTFDDVAGQDEAKEALKEIVDFLHSPEKYKDIGAQLPKGALLVGPPGTARRCWPRRSRVRRRFPSSRFRAPNLLKCSSAWARPACATCSSRRRRRRPASCSSTKSTPSARAAIPPCPAATTSANRRSISC